MCMRTHLWNLFPRTTKESITVYKVMRGKPSESRVRSPHQFHFYDLGVTEHANIRRTLGVFPPRFLVNEGLHAFVDVIDAYREMYEQGGRAFGYHVYECEIPAGSKIFRGIWDNYATVRKIPNIVSNKLIITKIFEEE